MRAPLHQRTKKIGACIADPFANGEGPEEIDTLTIPDGGQAAGVSTLSRKLGALGCPVNQARDTFDADRSQISLRFF
jgi:hypothetical protein